MYKMVCFGDSITARKEGFDKPILTTKLSSILKNFTVINAGNPGDNTFDALARVEKDVKKHNPDIVIILFGANDAALHKRINLETYKANLIKINNLLKQSEIIYISPAPVDERIQDARTNVDLRQYSLVVEEVAKTTNSYFIDFFTELFSLENYPLKLKGLANDGLHFGEEGYNFLVDLIIKKLRENGY